MGVGVSACPTGQGGILSGSSVGSHHFWPLSLEAHWESPLNCWGLGDWDAGVNRVSGSRTTCVMGLWGPQKMRHALE